jgi:hypothetical protein
MSTKDDWDGRRRVDAGGNDDKVTEEDLSASESESSGNLSDGNDSDSEGSSPPSQPHSPLPSPTSQLTHAELQQLLAKAARLLSRTLACAASDEISDGEEYPLKNWVMFFSLTIRNCKTEGF